MYRPVHVAGHKMIKQFKKQKEQVPKGVKLIQAPSVWQQTKGEGVTVAVLDTGCDATHDDLAARIIGGRNFTDDDRGAPANFTDYHGHGTHVAGIIGASENTYGVIGVAPKVNLLIVKVLERNGTGEYQWIVDGITYAISENVDIISMSLGAPDPHSPLHNVIKTAVLDKQIPVVCAAGNDGDGDHRTDEIDYPASYQEVISVGAVDFKKRASLFSNSNNKIDLVALGKA